MTSTFDDLAIMIANMGQYGENLKKLVLYLCEEGAKEIREKFGAEWDFDARFGKRRGSQTEHYCAFFSAVHGRLDHTTKYHLKCLSIPFQQFLEFVVNACKLELFRKGITSTGYWTMNDEDTLKWYVESPRHEKMLRNHYPKTAELGYLKRKERRS